MYKLYAMNQESKMIPVLIDKDESIIDENFNKAIEQGILVWKIFINED